MTKPTYRITQHAREEAERRGIPFEILQKVIEAPEQIVIAHSERMAYQSRVEIEGKLYVVRAIIEIANPLVVITVYRTSKIEKYWSNLS